MISQLKSILEASEDRIRSPWFGSIVIAWLCVNWKAVSIFILSESTVEQKIAVIVKEYYSVEYWFVYPLVAASAFTVLSPLISFLVFWLNHQFKVQQDFIKKRSELRSLEFDSELNFRRKRMELVASERFEGLDDYSEKRARIRDLESIPE